MSDNPARDIKHVLWGLVAATVVLWGVVLVLAVINYHNAQQVKDSLCSLRDDRIHSIDQAQKSLADTQQFLKDHPHGTSDFSVAEIQKGIDSQEANIRNQQQTVSALNSIGC